MLKPFLVHRQHENSPRLDLAQGLQATHLCSVKGVGYADVHICQNSLNNTLKPMQFTLCKHFLIK